MSRLLPVASSLREVQTLLIHDPESQRRARAEIDGFYDEDTLPKWQDEQSLPFVRAVIKEVIRWRPPLPMAVPHRLEQGRRVCPGIQTAEQDAFIALSRLLWAFEFTAPPGVEVGVDPFDAFVGESVRTPAEFSLTTTPRSERRVQTIEREMTVAKETFSQYGLYK
ncbi:hypothetical protein FRC07_001686 [Ceratobasidium sp. 392]|nr:hypothetical protein FRC07_001686 [Ceratobasidium sp. 392]